MSNTHPLFFHLLPARAETVRPPKPMFQIRIFITDGDCPSALFRWGLSLRLTPPPYLSKRYSAIEDLSYARRLEQIPIRLEGDCTSSQGRGRLGVRGMRDAVPQAWREIRHACSDADRCSPQPHRERLQADKSDSALFWLPFALRRSKEAIRPHR